MNRTIYIYLSIILVILMPSIQGVQSLRQEILNDKLIRSAIRVSTSRIYMDVKDENTQWGHVQSLNNPHDAPQEGVSLDLENLNQYFHDQSGTALHAYKSPFKGNEVRGCVYSINNEHFKDKIFISFPGTKSMNEWVKNFFGITHFRNNIQKSYYDDIEDLYSCEGEGSFIRSLYNHINFKNSNYDHEEDNYEQPDNLNSFEYYFTGHSRGGGLAFVSALKFKNAYPLDLGKVKVSTFCIPRLTNAHNVQSDFINTFGYDNIVHFVRPSDLIPNFPFQFVENQGVQILLQPGSFFFPGYSHRVPDQEELEIAVTEHTLARGVGWLYPFRAMITIEAKPLFWGIGGACVAYYLFKSGITEGLSKELRELYFKYVF